MTANTHFKQLVRRRVATHGEPYSTARADIVARSADVSFDDPTVVAVHGRHGQSVTFTPDGIRLLSAGQDARIATLDAHSGREKDLVGHDKVVNAVTVTPDGATVSVSSDRTVRTWDLSTGTPLATMRGHRDAVVALDVSPDGRTP